MLADFSVPIVESRLAPVQALSAPGEANRTPYWCAMVGRPTFRAYGGFLSHTTADKPIVRRLADDLELPAFVSG